MTQTAAGPGGPATTHKEDSLGLPASAQSIPTWRDLVISWYAGGPKPPSTILREAARYGLPDQAPQRSKDRVRVLALAGLDPEQVMAAVPELHPLDVVEIIERIPGEAFTITALHVQGHTVLEIAVGVGLTRPKVYYWLRRAGLKPNVRNRNELTVRQRSQIRKAYDLGEPMTGIARRFRVSYEQVRYATREGRSER